MKVVAVVTVILAAVLSAGIPAHANEPSTVRARPRIPGDAFPEFRVSDISGNSKKSGELVNGEYAMFVFLPAQALQQKNLRDYFQTVRGYIEQLGYTVFVVSTPPPDSARQELYERRGVKLYIDNDRSAFRAMGLADDAEETSSVIAGAFLVSPRGKILSQFTSSDNSIPFSGDALVLAARISKQLEEENRGNGNRSGPTIAPMLVTSPQTPALFAPASSSVDKPDIASEAAAPASGTTDATPPNTKFAVPDESVLRLLTIDDIARTNSYWLQASVGMTAYDARRNTWSPRWSPALQFGRRFNSFGTFLNVALDQTFDLTQEVKRLDIVHLGVGVERIGLYGRVRTSFSAGAAILNSDTDIDSRGKVGWYFDLRPIAVRWGNGPCNTFEFTPLALNVSVPVTRGIPLVLVGYMTTVSFEWATEPRL